MLTFFKNAKKFLDLKSAHEEYHALHYKEGRVYASSAHVLVWLDGEFGKRGSYDFVTGKKPMCECRSLKRSSRRLMHGLSMWFWDRMSSRSCMSS